MLIAIPPDYRTSLENLLLASRPGLTTEEVFTIHRTLDVILGILLITNYLRSVGISFGENGAVGLAISGPILSKPYLEAILYGISVPLPPSNAL